MTHQQAVGTLASERYLLDEMDEPERATFEEHYFSCTACAEDVRSGALMRDGTRAGLLEGREARVVPFRPRRLWYQSAAIPWAVAATLAIVAGYQTIVMVPALRPLNEARALAPVSLRPASRGQEPRVAVGPDSAAITLAIDTSSAVPGSELSYDLRTVAGAIAVSGKAQSPAAGTPLLLLIPVRAVKTPGHYVLSVAGSEYPFEVVAQ
jgi:Putative zinc-finger